MKVRYFYLDENDRLYKIAQRHMEAAWFHERAWDDSDGTKPLRIVTFICDDDFRPLKGFVIRASTQDGWLTEESRREVVMAGQSGMGNILSGKPMPTEFPLIDKQLEGWPESAGFLSQLAIALDVPIEHVPPLQFGGPLLVAASAHMTVKQALTYFDVGP